ncbi:MAG: hypothetical protein ACRDJH_25970 [Thermomicrobiales bacterium]
MAVVSQSQPGQRLDVRQATRRGVWGRRVFGRDWQIAWLFVLPLAVILAGFVAYPFVAGIILSFQHKVIGGEATWVGVDNFRALLVGDQYSAVFWKSVWVSLVYTFNPAVFI